jgi:hypothetical protein
MKRRRPPWEESEIYVPKECLWADFLLWAEWEEGVDMSHVSALLQPAIEKCINP